MSVSEFFHMGGYAGYVWGSYGLTLFVLYMNYLFAVRRERRLVGELSVQKSQVE